MCLLLVSAQLCQANSFSENEVKAGYLYRLLYFADWPIDSQSNTSEICFLGENSLENALAPMRGATVNGKVLVVKTLAEEPPLELLLGCQILYTGGNSLTRNQVEGVLRMLQDYPVLTISDAVGFVESGGMIKLVSSGDNIKFEINSVSTQRAGIKLRARLKRLAIRILDERGLHD